MSWGNKGRARSIASVLCCLAVVLGELVLLTAVYHRPAAVHRQRVTQAQLWGQLTDATPSAATAGHITAAITTLRHEGLSSQDLADLSAAGHALTLNPADKAAMIKARTADDALGIVLRDRQQTIDNEAETVYVILLALASIGWFGWFRRVIRRQRKLEHTLTEQTARAQGEAKLAALVRNAGDVIAVIDQDSTITYVSPSASAVVAATPDDLVGTRLIELFHPDDIDHFLHVVDATSNGFIHDLRA